MNNPEYEEARQMFMVYYYNKTTERIEQAFFDNGKAADLFLEMIIRREDIDGSRSGKNAWAWSVMVEK